MNKLIVPSFSVDIQIFEREEVPRGRSACTMSIQEPLTVVMMESI